MKFSRLLLLPTLFIGLLVTSRLQAEKISVLIVDGQNNHDWDKMTPIHKKTLEQTGLFEVAVSTTPPKKGDGDWSQWRPEFSKYDVVVSNYNGKLWPDEVRQSFVDYIKGGGGFVVVHAADNAFSQWPEYNEMIAVGGWGKRTEKHGPYIRFRDGKVSLDTSPGRGGSHGPQHAFQVVSRDTEHPITNGLPTRWLHARDELYDSLRGPAKNFTLLATAYSEKSKEHEPMLLTIAYGKGRVFHTPMGHVSPTDSIRCVGFQTVFVRGTEWAATGKVTTAVPANFPAADRVSIADPEDVVWKTLIRFTAGSCCDKAQKIGRDCAHPCCRKALAAGKVCSGCNAKS